MSHVRMFHLVAALGVTVVRRCARLMEATHLIAPWLDTSAATDGATAGERESRACYLVPSLLRDPPPPPASLSESEPVAVATPSIPPSLALVAPPGGGGSVVAFRFDFSRFFLPLGLFERLLCACVREHLAAAAAAAPSSSSAAAVGDGGGGGGAPAAPVLSARHGEYALLGG